MDPEIHIESMINITQQSLRNEEKSEDKTDIEATYLLK